MAGRLSGPGPFGYALGKFLGDFGNGEGQLIPGEAKKKRPEEALDGQLSHSATKVLSEKTFMPKRILARVPQAPHKKLLGHTTRTGL